jgi:membrane fusion protein, multidrug efflux system
MKLRMFLMLVAAGTLVGVLGVVKIKQVNGAIAEQSAFRLPPEAVTTVVARQERWPATLGVIGSVAAVRGVTISADLPGVVDKIAFDSGMSVHEGDILAELDTRTEQAQLAAAQAQLELTKANLERTRGLRDEQIVAPADFDKAEAEFKRADAAIGEVSATIARKTIEAPFSGVLGIRQANLGQYLAAGTPIVSLQSLNPVYVNFAVPQQQVARVRVGTEVSVSLDNAGANMLGTVTAIDSVIDENTRNIQIQATIPNPGGRLHPGMFVQTSVALGSAQSVIALPTSAIAYAPYGDSVFVVSTMNGPDGKPFQGVVQRFVKLGASRGDQVAIESGVGPGDEVVTSGVFKLRNGAAVQINNKVQPSNKPAPRPEEG